MPAEQINGYQYCTVPVGRVTGVLPRVWIWIGRRRSHLGAGAGYSNGAALKNAVRDIFGLDPSCMSTYSTTLIQDLPRLGIERISRMPITSMHSQFGLIMEVLQRGDPLSTDPAWYFDRWSGVEERLRSMVIADIRRTVAEPLERHFSR